MAPANYTKLMPGTNFIAGEQTQIILPNVEPTS
jgi:hypothetical protein